ncbi:MAG: SDR family oxidoreductase [Bacteroidales bacterium]
MERKVVLITGASSGIGFSCAKAFAAAGFDLILNARRAERIEQLAGELAEQWGVECLPMVFDVRDREAVFNLLSKLEGKWRKIDVLVNNAGLALGLSDIQDGDLDDWDQMIDTNVKGLLYVSKAVMPLMIEQGQGQIINIGSIAGRETYPKGNVYCATKHAVDSLTKAMRMDLLPHGIRVSQVSPGAAQTEFSEVRFKGDTQRAEKVYEGFKPLTGDDIAHCVLFCATLPAHVTVNDMLVMPSAQASAGLIHRTLS